MTIHFSDLLFSLGQNAALLFSLTFVYVSLTYRLRDSASYWQAFAIGCLFGVIALMSVVVPLQLSAETIVEIYAVIGAMAVIFGGVSAGLVAGAIASLCVFLKPIDNPAMSLGMQILFLLIMAFWVDYWNKKSIVPHLPEFLMVGACLAAVGLGWQWLVMPNANYPLETLLFTFVVYMLVVGVIGQMISREQRRYEARNALAKSQEQLARAERLVQVIKTVVDLEGRWLEAQPKLCTLLGYTLEELRERTFMDITHPDDAMIDWELCQQLLRGDIPSFELEKRYICKNGAIIWVYLSSSLVRDDHGKPLHFLSYIQDITARKAIEDALQKREAQYRTLVNHLPVIIYSLNPRDMTFTSLNPAFEAIMGWPREEWLGRVFTHILPIDQIPLATAQFARVANGEEIAPFELKALTAHKKVVTLEIIPSPQQENGQVIQIMGIARNITERRQAENELLQEKYLSDSVVNSLPGVFYIFDHEGRFLRWNSNVETVTGYTADEIRQVHPLQLFSPDDHSLVADTIREVFIMGEASLEARVMAKNNKVIPYFFLGRRIELDGVPCIIGTGIDISARKQAEQQAFEMAAERERSRVLSDFVHYTAHDFKTPLAIINSSIYLMSRSRTPEQQERHRQLIEEQVTRLSKLIEAMLTMTRLENRANFAFRATDLNQILRDAGTRMQASALGKQIQVVWDLDELLPQIEVDGSEMGNAFMHLIENAIQNTFADGTISLKTRLAEGQVVVEISDTGVGIHAEDLPHIFEQFYRGDKARSKETGTAGLGLTIVKKIIDVHQGEIAVESSPEKGTTFRIALPLISEFAHP